MRLHHYTPAVPESYCVGVHNGHGFGSLFAKLFSKVAAKTVAKTAAKAVARVSKVAARKLAKEAPKLLKKAGKVALEEGTKAAANFAQDKIQVLKKKAINSQIPASLTHSLANIAEEGVQKLQHTVPKTIGAIGNRKIDEYTKKLENAAGIADKKLSSKKIATTIKKRNIKRKAVNKGPPRHLKRYRYHEIQQLNKILDDDDE